MPCSLRIIRPACDICGTLFPTQSRVSLEFVHLAPMVFPACAMHSPILHTRIHSNARLLDRCMHTSPRTRWFVRITGRTYTAHSCFHGCTLCAAQPSGSDSTTLHPCTVTATHHLHTRPPEYVSCLRTCWCLTLTVILSSAVLQASDLAWRAPTNIFE